MKKIIKTSVARTHYFRLTYRSILFLAVLIDVIYRKVNGLGMLLDELENHYPAILVVVWVVFMIEMIGRFFPSKLESPGCQKQFKSNYKPTGRTDAVLHDDHAGFIVALVWIILNMGIGALYQLGVINQDVMLLVCLAYSVCDIICILFFCPFQTWFLKNKCCVSCRIYNWDFAMMFTPLFFIPSLETWSILLIALVVLIKWELTVWKYPEQFSENTNEALKCKNCNEKLCMHKKQLAKFSVTLNDLAVDQIKRILKK